MQLVAAHLLKVQIIECTLITRNVGRRQRGVWATILSALCPVRQSLIKSTTNTWSNRWNIAVKSFVRTVFYFSPSLQSTLANGHALNVLRPLRSTVFVREPLKSLHTHTQNPQPLKPYGFIAGRFTWTQLTRINPASVRGRTMQSSRSRLSRLTIAKIHSTSNEIKIHF